MSVIVPSGRSRALSDVTKLNCDCGHADCEAILAKLAPTSAFASSSVPTTIKEANEPVEDGRPPPPPAARHGGAPLKRIFFSPHPDDVAYSCFGMVSREGIAAMDYKSGGGGGCSTTGSASSCGGHSGNRRDSGSSIDSSTASDALSSSNGDVGMEMGDTLIVTVFSKSRCANGAIGRSLRHCVNATTQMRTREDEQFARSVGAQLVSLGMSDTSARNENSRRPDLLAKAATRNTSLNNGQLTVHHASFVEAKRRIRPYVELAIERSATIHIPLAVGCHVDHWMVRVAVLACLVEWEQNTQWASWRAAQQHFDSIPLGSRRGSVYAPPPLVCRRGPASQLVFYEDLPYAFIGTDDLVRQTVGHFLPRNVRMQLTPLSDAAWKRKVAAVSAYASQMKPALLGMLHDHAMILAKRGATLDPQWPIRRSGEDHPDLVPCTMAERAWVLDSIRGISARLVTTLSPGKSEEHEIDAEAAVLATPAPVVREIVSAQAAVDSLTAPLASSELRDQTSPLSVVGLRSPKPQLRRMSSCPPSAFPLPYHAPVSPP